MECSQDPFAKSSRRREEFGWDDRVAGGSRMGEEVVDIFLRQTRGDGYGR